MPQNALKSHHVGQFIDCPDMFYGIIGQIEFCCTSANQHHTNKKVALTYAYICVIFGVSEYSIFLLNIDYSVYLYVYISIVCGNSFFMKRALANYDYKFYLQKTVWCVRVLAALALSSTYQSIWTLSSCHNSLRQMDKKLIDNPESFTGPKI